MLLKSVCSKFIFGLIAESAEISNNSVHTNYFLRSSSARTDKYQMKNTTTETKPRRNAAAKTTKTPVKSAEKSSNGNGSAPDFTDKVDKKLAAKENVERKESQKKMIKKIGNEKLVEMLYQMILGRRFEEKCAEVYRIGKIGGFCHLYIGQEAVGIGALFALEKEDMVITSYRDHVQAIVKGMSSEEILAELYGKRDGNVGGKGGSMHFFSKEHQFYGGHGIVGGQIGVATGMAYAAKYRSTGQATLCFFGEAAVNQGIFHESLNMAQLWNLPVVYICENNQYGMGTAIDRAMSLKNVAKKAEAYGMHGEFVDGMDVLAVYEAVSNAVERARQGSPSLLEIRCYRFMGHSMSDPGKYRQQAEIEKNRERDPIILFQQSLLESKVITAKDIEDLETRALEEVERAVKFAEESPLPDESELLTDVLAD